MHLFALVLVDYQPNQVLSLGLGTKHTVGLTLYSAAPKFVKSTLPRFLTKTTTQKKFDNKIEITHRHIYTSTTGRASAVAPNIQKEQL